MSHQVIDNVLFSDHAICVINTLIATEPQKHMKKVKLFSTVIPEYNLIKADESDWNALNSELSSLDWENLLYNKSVEDSADIIISHIETAVKNSM